MFAAHKLARHGLAQSFLVHTTFTRHGNSGRPLAHTPLTLVVRWPHRGEFRKTNLAKVLPPCNDQSLCLELADRPPRRPRGHPPFSRGILHQSPRPPRPPRLCISPQSNRQSLNRFTSLASGKSTRGLPYQAGRQPTLPHPLQKVASRKTVAPPAKGIYRLTIVPPGNVTVRLHIRQAHEIRPESRVIPNQLTYRTVRCELLWYCRMRAASEHLPRRHPGIGVQAFFPQNLLLSRVCLVGTQDINSTYNQKVIRCSKSGLVWSSLHTRVNQAPSCQEGNLEAKVGNLVNYSVRQAGKQAVSNLFLGGGIG